jgi:hypothetical protein
MSVKAAWIRRFLYELSRKLSVFLASDLNEKSGPFWQNTANLFVGLSGIIIAEVIIAPLATLYYQSFWIGYCMTSIVFLLAAYFTSLMFRKKIEGVSNKRYFIAVKLSSLPITAAVLLWIKNIPYYKEAMNDEGPNATTTNAGR